MPARANAATTAPDDLAEKRSANSLTAVRDEAEREQGDGRVAVTLKTRLGFHDMRVPPMDEWTAVARHAMNREDSLTWAIHTLSGGDALKWQQLNPTVREEREFWEDYGRALGQSLGEGRASASS
jgi:hypothetical protein